MQNMLKNHCATWDTVLLVQLPMHSQEADSFNVTCVPKGVTRPVECPNRGEEAVGYLLCLQNISAPGSLSL